MSIVLQLATTLGALLLAGVTLWLTSVRLRNAGIIDAFWGPLCALPAILTFLLVDGSSPRDVVLVGLVTLWAMRLAIHLGQRNFGHTEDYRYAAMRQKQGSDAAFARWSLIFVFLLQPVIAWAISLPVQLGQLGPDAPLGPIAFLGIVVFCIGLAFETIGDAQLKAFRSDPTNKGKLMTKGLWAWTRHPNYFGDACLWFGLAIIALESPLGWIGLLSPFLMAHFLINVSGKALLERGMSKKYAEYEAYK